jgi:hypothetical protein
MSGKSRNESIDVSVIPIILRKSPALIISVSFMFPDCLKAIMFGPVEMGNMNA